MNVASAMSFVWDTKPDFPSHPRGSMDFNLDMLPRGPWFEVWTCFPEVHWNWNLDVLLRGPMDLKFWRASQRSNGLKFGRVSQRFDGLKFRRASQRFDGFEVWTCFPEVHWNWILDVLPRGLIVWSLDVPLRGPMDLKFRRAFQRSDGSILDVLPRGSMDWIWTCFPEVHWNWIWTCFPEVRWFEVWTCFPKVHWNWSFDVLLRGPMDL